MLYREMDRCIGLYRKKSDSIVSHYYTMCISYPSKDDQQSCLEQSEGTIDREIDEYVGRIDRVRRMVDECMGSHTDRDMKTCIDNATREVKLMVNEASRLMYQ